MFVAHVVCQALCPGWRFLREERLRAGARRQAARVLSESSRRRAASEEEASRGSVGGHTSVGRSGKACQRGNTSGDFVASQQEKAAGVGLVVRPEDTERAARSPVAARPQRRPWWDGSTRSREGTRRVDRAGPTSGPLGHLWVPGCELGVALLRPPKGPALVTPFPQCTYEGKGDAADACCHCSCH